VSGTRPLLLAEMERRATTGGSSLLAWRFAFSALEDPQTSCMTCGPGPPCQRLGCFGASGRVFLEKGFTPRAAVMLPHSLLSLRPFTFELSSPHCIRALQLHTCATADTMTSLGQPDRFQTEATIDVVRHLLGWSAPALAGRIRAGAVPLGDLAAGEFVLFTSYISFWLALPILPFFMMLLEEFGLQLQHLTPHSILQAAIFAHLREMFVGVAPCTSLFRHFFVLVKSGKAKDHLGAYYFQTRPDSTSAYIPSLGGARWENWRGDWVIASAEANDCLTLPSDRPRLDPKQWRTKPSLAPELQLVLDRIKSLAASGLTSMHVVGDFLKC
jgi:hypothetical protein